VFPSEYAVSGKQVCGTIGAIVAHGFSDLATSLSSRFRGDALALYRAVTVSEIVGQIEHIRTLLRQVRPKTNQEHLLFERREQTLKDFLSNLRRTGLRAMVPMVHELEELCGLVTGAGYRLLGYELDAIREYDHVLNGGRTHLVESHVFERDLQVELPLELAEQPTGNPDRMLNTLVRSWQRDVPLRALKGAEWRRPRLFYVHVGTEDDPGSILPNGALAQVELVSQEEALQPRPSTIYLLQFPNGYRFSRCIVRPGCLQLLAPREAAYQGREEFPYPSNAVRIVGKVLSFAIGLPQPSYQTPYRCQPYAGTAALVLPWEHQTRSAYLATNSRRFARSEEELRLIEDVLRSKLPKLASERTKRRYRSETPSEPHVDALIQLTLENYGRFSDSLRLGGHMSHDRNRFSLETFLRARHYTDLVVVNTKVQAPFPGTVWQSMRAESAELAPLLLLKFPRLSHLGNRILQISRKSALPGIQPPLSAGSWILLEELSAMPDIHGDALKAGWQRPLYALQRGLETMLGFLEREGASLLLLPAQEVNDPPVHFDLAEIENLRRVCGAIVRVA